MGIIRIHPTTLKGSGTLLISYRVVFSKKCAAPFLFYSRDTMIRIVYSLYYRLYRIVYGHSYKTVISCGYTKCYNSGILHCETGPCVSSNFGYYEWRINGSLHRVDGPAVIYPDGYKYWYLNGKMYTFKEYVHKIFPEDSPQRTLFVLKWS